MSTVKTFIDGLNERTGSVDGVPSWISLDDKMNQIDIDSENEPYKMLDNTEKSKKKLNKILLTRNRMLEVNIQRNETKNKIIYSMFSFIILLIFIITVIHYNIKK